MNIQEYLVEKYTNNEDIFPLTTTKKLVFQYVMEDLLEEHPENVVQVKVEDISLKPIEVFQKLSDNDKIELFSICHYCDDHYLVMIYSSNETFLTLHKKLINDGNKTFETLVK